jgi:hypothetical protein
MAAILALSRWRPGGENAKWSHDCVLDLHGRAYSAL